MSAREVSFTMGWLGFLLMLLKAILGDHAQVRNLGDVRWLATEDGSQGKGTGRHIACFILEPATTQPTEV